MTLGHALRRLVDDTRSFGASAVLHDLQQRALNRVIPFQILKGMTGVLADVNPDLVEAGAFDARFAYPDEMLAGARAEYDMTPSFVRAALGRGDECFALYDGDCLAS